MSYERDGDSGFYRLWIGMVIGITAANLGHAIFREDPEDAARRVQIQYEQVEDQLERSRQVGNLILNDEENTFTFVSPADGTCTGTFEESGENGEIVQISEALDCTLTVPATR